MISIFKMMEELTEEDFSSYPLRVTFYEPEELNALVSLGFDEAGTREALGAIGYDDSFAFPVPNEGVHDGFKYPMAAVTLTTSLGTSMSDRTGAATVASYSGRRFVFNRALRDRCLSATRELQALPGKSEVFPLTVRIPLLGTTYELSESPD